METFITDITRFITLPLEYIVGFMNYGFTLFGVTLSIGTWWSMCLIFGLVLKFVSWLAGDDMLMHLFVKGFKGD